MNLEMFGSSLVIVIWSASFIILFDQSDQDGEWTLWRFVGDGRIMQPGKTVTNGRSGQVVQAGLCKLDMRQILDTEIKQARAQRWGWVGFGRKGPKNWTVRGVWGLFPLSHLQQDTILARFLR
ncbi:hypothetical protein Btru_024433 [Bulinus truncatus]|nr:hypothetical protein Btru_024433 [Bulinus truncatus]